MLAFSFNSASDVFGAIGIVAVALGFLVLVAMIVSGVRYKWLQKFAPQEEEGQDDEDRSVVDEARSVFKAAKLGFVLVGVIAAFCMVVYGILGR